MIELISESNGVLLVPEEKHFTIVQRYTEAELVLPEKLCIDRFGLERWHRITSGMDSVFDAYPYN